MSGANYHPTDEELSAVNWQKGDGQSALWRQMTAVAKTEEEWARLFLEPRLRKEVPAQLADLLEVARAAMMYSWYYYPLATLGMEQCYRILDSGARMRCEKAGIATKKPGRNGKEFDTSFDENIKALKSNGIIAQSAEIGWHSIRWLRNNSSHPRMRSIFDPGQAQGMLESIVEDLNLLFSSDPLAKS
jgi:hypothetical protein